MSSTRIFTEGAIAGALAAVPVSIFMSNLLIDSAGFPSDGAPGVPGTDGAGFTSTAIIQETSTNDTLKVISDVLTLDTRHLDTIELGTLSSNSSHNTKIGYQSGQDTSGWSGNIAIGNSSGQFPLGNTTIAIGSLAGQTGQQTDSIAIGRLAGSVGQSGNSVAIGTVAGQTSQKDRSVAIGFFAGRNNQGSESIAIGFSAGSSNQEYRSIAIGNFAGRTNQGTGGISIGINAGQTNQGTGGIAIGINAGQTNQKTGSVCLGNDVNIDSTVVALRPSIGTIPNLGLNLSDSVYYTSAITTGASAGIEILFKDGSGVLKRGFLNIYDIINA